MSHGHKRKKRERAAKAAQDYLPPYYGPQKEPPMQKHDVSGLSYSPTKFGKCPQCKGVGLGPCGVSDCFYLHQTRPADSHVQAALKGMEMRAKSTTLTNGYTLPDGHGTSTGSLTTTHDHYDDDDVWERDPKTNSWVKVRRSGSAPNKWFGKYSCQHKAQKMVTKINDTEVYIGALNDVRTHEFDLVIQCAVSTSFFGRKDTSRDIVLPARFESLREFVYGVPANFIVLPWDDMSAPPLFSGFWPALIKLLPRGKVVLVCQGGHGRSGTALAALLMAAHGFTAKRAIAYVRKEHCQEAIETTTQEGYLELLEKLLAN